MKVRLSSILFLILFSVYVQADIISVPKLNEPVTDLTSTLSNLQKSHIDTFLFNFANNKGSQIAVLIIPTHGDETIEQFGIRVADEWKLGRNNVDDGVILIVAKDDREVRIEVGYGLEGTIPDAYAKRIINTIILPEFRAGDFYHGIFEGVQAIAALIDGEELPEFSKKKQNSEIRALGLIGPLTVILMITIISSGAYLKRKFGTWKSALSVFIIAFIIYFLISNSAVIASFISGFLSFIVGLIGFSNRRGGGGTYTGFGGGFGGGFSSGGSMGGGGFGGGFSGGGGGFGGGGASGGW